jgi:hypothetical protein
VYPALLQAQQLFTLVEVVAQETAAVLEQVVLVVEAMAVRGITTLDQTAQQTQVVVAGVEQILFHNKAMVTPADQAL